MEAKPKISPWTGSSTTYFLAIGIFNGDVHDAAENDISAAAVFARLIDALAGGELADFDLTGENADFVVIEQGEKRDVAKFLR